MPTRLKHVCPFLLLNFVSVHSSFNDAIIVTVEIGRENAGRQLYQAAFQGDLVTMASALAQGAEVNWSHAEEEGRTALIGSTFGVSSTMDII